MTEQNYFILLTATKQYTGNTLSYINGEIFSAHIQHMHIVILLLLFVFPIFTHRLPDQLKWLIDFWLFSISQVNAGIIIDI